MVSDTNILTALPAPASKRLLAFVYDMLLVLAIVMVATAIAQVVSQAATGTTDLSQHRAILRLWLIACIFAFFGWFWTHGGQTLGMRAWKIELQNENGQPVSWPQALLRFALGILTFGVGLLWVNISQKQQALYDLLARTRMITVEAKHIPQMR